MNGPTTPLANFEKMLAAGRDGALLRYSLGNEHLKAGNPAVAAEHLQRAVTFDPEYTAAWKLLGRALAESGRQEAALAAYRDGIACAARKGDKQAGKEMTVFARRIEKALAAAAGEGAARSGVDAGTAGGSEGTVSDGDPGTGA